jgi:DNA polymerase-3 subunit chi
MPQADFYLVDTPRFRADPLLLVCELAKRAYEAERALLVLADSREQAEALDDALWAFEDDAFVPHQIAGEDDDETTPVLIVPPGAGAADRPHVINLRAECAPAGYELVQELVPFDAAQRDASRARWAGYKARGEAVRKLDALEP